MFFLLTELFKINILNNLLNIPKQWYKSIDDLANESHKLKLFVIKNSITHKFIKDFVLNGDKRWKKILQKLQPIQTDQMYSEEYIWDLVNGKIAVFETSIRFKSFAEVLNSVNLIKEFSFDDIKFKTFSEVRLIRREYQYSNQIVKT